MFQPREWYPFVYLGLLLTVIGCTFNAPVDAPPAPAVSGEQRVPVAVGVYYSPEFLAYTHRQSYGFGPHSVEFDVGESSAIHFSRVFNAYFQRALRFSDRPTAARPAADVDAVLIPEIEQLTMTDPSLYGWAGTWRTELVYRFHLVDPAGQPIANWTVEGVGSKGGVDWVGPKIPGEAFAAALEEAGRNFVNRFSHVPEVSRWLSARGIQVSQRGVFAPDPWRLGVPTAF